MAALVTLEGIEGCGKSTQAGLLAAHLEDRGLDAVLTCEPGGTRVTAEIRRLLADPASELDPRAELLLFLADRAQHVTEVIRPALERGAVVICDRYSDSTIAYQCHGRGHERALVDELNAWAAGQLVPDLTLWIDCEIEIGLERARVHSGGPGDRFEAEPTAFHQRVRDGFAGCCKDDPGRVRRIDGNRDQASVTASVLATVDEFLASQSGAAR